jgi:hypothetical protein
VTEAQFQKWVLQLAKLRGWRVAHFRTAQTTKGAYMTPVAADGKGFPDLVLVRNGRLVFAELKAEKGRLGPDQKDWIDAISGCGIEMYLWKPADANTIEEALK